jgi:hypothetical protein
MPDRFLERVPPTGNREPDDDVIGHPGETQLPELERVCTGVPGPGRSLVDHRSNHVPRALHHAKGA